uniref:Uncharacterized protein n=1 Tax=Sphaerodactylus townsendi TaxID=933632 RepID=A0ACB8FQC3_9SAUR
MQRCPVSLEQKFLPKFPLPQKAQGTGSWELLALGEVSLISSPVADQRVTGRLLVSVDSPMSVDDACFPASEAPPFLLDFPEAMTCGKCSLCSPPNKEACEKEG